MPEKPSLPVTRIPLVAGSYPGERDTGLHDVSLDALGPQEIEVPHMTAELAIGDDLQADLLLPLDDPGDLAVLHRLQLCRRNRALGALVASLLRAAGRNKLPT